MITFVSINNAKGLYEGAINRNFIFYFMQHLLILYVYNINHLIQSNMNPGFKEYEDKGRNYLTQMFKEYSIDFTSNPFARNDAVFTSTTNKKYVVEVKTRNVTSEAFKDDILEYKKADSLKAISKQLRAEGNDVEVLYVMVFSDNIALTYNLTSIWKNPEQLKLVRTDIVACNKTTVNCTEKVNKLNYYLPKSIGTKTKV